ncbi:HNH endonuclease [Pseudoclavibacter sp. VKM Ac-2867]|uniref:HNH endonuclease n=1 Tax=Pseudoclavibacter sp. VKM Ac-2867 TaxID=2783829 RepID=UPI00188CBF3C|nr:HNH endonuclease signature motif containing protein [Pseudoclavibacter sp. VKM Ac-2867]MBF4457792.1 HNH endonuclease [Pseudoclavibacter sp. VKM Ac-2867]
MQNEPIDDEAPRVAAPGRAARLREMRRRLAAGLGVEQGVVDDACQRAEDRTLGARRALLVLALADNQRHLNRLHGEQAELHARALELGLRGDELAGTSSPALEVRSLASEIAAVSGRSQRSVQIEFGRADAIANRFEPVQEAMKTGAISRAHALVIVDAGLRITHPDPAELERRREHYARVVLEKAVSTTPGRIKSFAERVAEELTEESLDERFERARRTRRVMLSQLEDGLGELSVIDSYAKLVAIFDRTTRQALVISDAERRTARERAHAHPSGTADADGQAEAQVHGDADGPANGQADGCDNKPPGAPDARSRCEDPLPEPRSLDEVRADVLSGGFLRATPEELRGRAPIKAKISIVIPAETLLAPTGYRVGRDDAASTDGAVGTVGTVGTDGTTGADGTAGAARTGSPVSPDRGDRGDRGEAAPRGRPGPALLNGYTPVPTAEVRRLIDAAPEFERIFTDPLKGTLVEVDSYRPTSAMRRRLAARDGRCRFLGCMMPASRCDIDHTKAWEEGGPTSLANLGHLCGGHHTGKHHGDWEVRQLPDGVYEWRSPSGLIFRDAPVQFGRLTALPLPEPGVESSATPPSTTPPSTTLPSITPASATPTSTDSPGNAPPSGPPPASGPRSTAPPIEAAPKITPPSAPLPGTDTDTPSTDRGGQIALPSTAPGLSDSHSSGRADDTADAQRAGGGGDLENVGGGDDLGDEGDATQVGDVDDVRDPIRPRHQHNPGELECDCEHEDEDEDEDEDKDRDRDRDEGDRRSRFPKLGFLEEFRRERAAKKAAIESGSSRRGQPEFRPTRQRGDEGGGDQLRAESSRGERSDSSDDPAPF